MDISFGQEVVALAYLLSEFVSLTFSKHIFELAATVTRQVVSVTRVAR